MRFGILPFLAAGLVAGLCLIGASAQAVPLDGFTCITNNSAGDCAIGEAALSATLTDDGPGAATLEITMTGSDSAVVKQVFFDSSLLKSASFLGSGGVGNVDFADDSKAGNLPAGRTVGFGTDFSSSAGPPSPKNGIGYHSQDSTSGQSALFGLVYGGTFEQLVEDLRVGVHVIAFQGDGSEAFTIGDGPQIPEPTSALVFALGFGVVSAARRRSR
jgi:hypothetical protein